MDGLFKVMTSSEKSSGDEKGRSGEGRGVFLEHLAGERTLVKPDAHRPPTEEGHRGLNAVEKQG